MSAQIKVPSTAVADGKETPVSLEVHHEVEQFLFHEAGLLDSRQYKLWLQLLTEDVQYRVTARVIRDAAADPIDYAIIDEARGGLNSRVAQISNPRLTRAENPPSFTRRLIANIRTVTGDRAEEVRVISAFLAYRGRAGLLEGGFYVGERSDVLRRIDGSWRLARRLVRLDQTMVFDGALSVLL